MKNHLIVGLGGTGGKIIRSLRKKIFDEYRSNDPEFVKIRYLYVDSSKEIMGLTDASWRVLGESVQLAPRSQLLITGSNLNQILENLSNYPYIKPWIGSREQWSDILGSIVGETLGGQKRRLGRFLFACKAREFRNQLTQLASELTSGGETSITFHVCAGLAGGTGSGSVIDTIAQIRAIYSDPRVYRIVVYTLLPEEIPAPNWNTGNYHANGYAALLELNALSVGAYRPCNVSGNGEPLQLSDPFNGCYIFCNRNDNGLEVNVEKTIPDIVADFLFQKLVSVRNAAALQTIERMENAENGDGTPEKRNGTNTPLRSKRFLTFGIKRLAVPEVEIREFLTYTFAREAALQLRYNNWDDTLGYLDSPRNQDFGEFVRDAQTLERWSLTDEHFTLSRGILQEEIKNSRWKPIVKEWLDIVPQFMGLVQPMENKKWLNEIERLMAQRFDETYRGLGVRKFYETKLNARKEYVRELRRRVEAELFEDWRTGGKSMHDLLTCVDALIQSLSERLQLADDRIARAQSSIANSEETVAANRVEYAKVSLLSNVFGRRRNLLDLQGEALRELYTARTLAEAWQFAKRLMQETVTEFRLLRTDISQCAGLVDDSIKDFQECLAERCRNGDRADLRQSVVRFYNPEYVRTFSKELERDGDVQKSQAQAVRIALIEQIASEQNFSAFHTKIDRQRFVDVLENTSAKSAQVAHDHAVTSDHARRPLLGGNILAQLEREYSGRDDDLRTFIHDLVTHAGSYLEFDPQAVVVGSANSKISQFLIVIPKTEGGSSFGDKIKALFRANLSGGIPIEIIESDKKPNEIVLLCLTNLFPLRYAKNLKFLSKQYEYRIEQSPNKDRIRLELHSEGDGSQWPELDIANEMAEREKTLPYLLLAKAMGMFTTIANPSTDEQELYLVGVDEDGLPVHTKIGKTIADAADTLDLLAAQNMVDAVVARLQEGAEARRERRDELKKIVRDDLAAVLADAKGDVNAPLYKRFLAAAHMAMQLLKS